MLPRVQMSLMQNADAGASRAAVRKGTTLQALRPVFFPCAHAAAVVCALTFNYDDVLGPPVNYNYYRCAFYTVCSNLKIAILTTFLV